MKIGLGLYRHMLTRDYYDFARQAGCTHVVVHLVDYFNQAAANPRDNQPTGGKYEPWGVAGDPERLWTVAELKVLREEIEGAGLVWAAIENLDPAHWHDILLDGPQRPQQIEKVKTIIRRMGEAGIPVLGYNFSLAGVCGRVTAPLGRGHAPVSYTHLDVYKRQPLRGGRWDGRYHLHDWYMHPGGGAGRTLHRRIYLPHIQNRCSRQPDHRGRSPSLQPDQ